MDTSRPLFDRMEAMAVLEELEELEEAVLDCADGEAWLAMLVRRAN